MVLHQLLKILSRGTDYARGVLLLLSVVLCGGSCKGIPRVSKGVVFRYPPHAGLRFGKRLDIGPFCVFDVPPGGRLTLGDSVKLTAGVVLSAVQSVDIGADCLIAEWVSIRDAQHRFDAGMPINAQALDCESVTIEPDVWLGRGSAVFRGAHIERGCVVGAGAQVRRERLGSNGVYVGVPVRRIAQRTPIAEK